MLWYSPKRWLGVVERSRSCESCFGVRVDPASSWQRLRGVSSKREIIDKGKHTASLLGASATAGGG